MLHVII